MPAITGFSPELGLPGSVLEVYGNYFSDKRLENIVTVGGEQAIVVEARRDKLKVLLGPRTKRGPIEVQVGCEVAHSDRDFGFPQYLDPHMRPGHPIFILGIYDRIITPPPTIRFSRKKLNVLLVLLIPSDLIHQASSYPLPDSFLSDVKTRLQSKWINDNCSFPQMAYDNTPNVHNYFDQASFHKLFVDVDTTRWYPLMNDRDYYIVMDDPDVGTNIRHDKLDQFWTETVSAAKKDAGLNAQNISKYDVIAGIVYLEGNNGKQIRCWSAEPRSSFNYEDPDTHASVGESLPHKVGLIAVDEQTDWRRCSHELGHYLIDTPSGLNVPGEPADAKLEYVTVLGEDLYSFSVPGDQGSQTPVPSWASAEQFDLMGDDQWGCPLFSAFNMERLDYYGPGDIHTIDWTEENGGTYNVMAHGLHEVPMEGCYHLVKICVAEGLYYYIEVRQRPLGDHPVQLFDTRLQYFDLCRGGVVVTKVMTGTVNNNQMMRYITLMHEERTLGLDEYVCDPERNLRITVTKIPVQDDPQNPLVCEVKVERMLTAPVQGSSFGLSITPWDSNYQSPDIWVLHSPPDGQHIDEDDQGRPVGHGQTPILGRVNKLYARINSRGLPRKDIKVYFYSIYPPGIGDDGNWSPIDFSDNKLADITADISNKGHFDTCIDWIPEVNVHTCVKVHIEPQEFENCYSDNMAQENFIGIDAASYSVPDPIVLEVTVRNPLKEKTTVFLNVAGVPRGFIVQFPYAWVNLGPLEKSTLEMIIVPTLDYNDYRKMELRSADIVISGHVPVYYKKELSSGNLPVSRMHRIGGITFRVSPKRGVDMKLALNKKKRKTGDILLDGRISPAARGVRVRVELVSDDGRLQTAYTNTDAEGEFHAAFKPFPVVKLPVKLQAIEKVLPGTYRAQAYIVDSPDVAAAESNAVRIKAGSR